MPRKSRGRRTYIAPEAEMIWPHERLRASRSGATGRQVARTAANTSRPRIVPSTSSVMPGLRSSSTSAFEPLATPLQNRSVAPVPKTPPAGTA